MPRPVKYSLPKNVIILRNAQKLRHVIDCAKDGRRQARYVIDDTAGMVFRHILEVPESGHFELNKIYPCVTFTEDFSTVRMELFHLTKVSNYHQDTPKNDEILQWAKVALGAAKNHYKAILEKPDLITPRASYWFETGDTFETKTQSDFYLKIIARWPVWYGERNKLQSIAAESWIKKMKSGGSIDKDLSKAFKRLKLPRTWPEYRRIRTAKTK